MPSVNIAQSIVEAIREALDLWKTFIATRQEAYNRQKDRRKDKAIAYAEQTYDKISVLYEFLYENVEIPDSKKAEFERIKTLIYKLRSKFNKYD